MKNSQKGFVNIILMVVIVAVVAVGGYFIFSKNGGQLSTSTTQVNDNLAQNDTSSNKPQNEINQLPVTSPKQQENPATNNPSKPTQTTTPKPTSVTTPTCDLDSAENNKFVGCIYSGKNFDTFKTELRPIYVLGTSVQTPASLKSSSAYKVMGLDVKKGYVTQPEGITMNGDFSIKLKGDFTFAPGSYTFYSLAGRYDGVRIKFNGITKIDQWNTRTYDDYFDETFSSQTKVSVEIEYYGNAKYSGFVTEYSTMEFGWRIPQTVVRNQFCVIPYPKNDYQIGSIVGQILEACTSFIPKLESLWAVQPSLAPYLITFITEPSAAYGNAGDQYRVALQIDKVKAEGLKLGTIVHEFTHIIQRPGYGFKDSNYLRASWVGEGLAEYAPYKLGYPISSGATTLGCDGGAYYTDGYRCAATFLNYVDKNYTGFISKINKIMRTDLLTNGTLSQPNEGGPMLLDAFLKHTGKSADELWLSCLQSDCQGGKQ